MADYQLEIDGENSLEQIELQIQGEEAGGSEFVKSQIANSGGKKTNVATFRELPSGQPKFLHLSSTPDLPDGMDNVWNGPMIVESQQQNVWAFREVGDEADEDAWADAEDEAEGDSTTDP